MEKKYRQKILQITVENPQNVATLVVVRLEEGGGAGHLGQEVAAQLHHPAQVQVDQQRAAPSHALYTGLFFTNSCRILVQLYQILLVKVVDAHLLDCLMKLKTSYSIFNV